MLIRPHDAPIDSEREWRDLVSLIPSVTSSPQARTASSP